MELKRPGLPGTPAQSGNAAEDGFAFELTLEQLSFVAGGALHDDESPKKG